MEVAIGRTRFLRFWDIVYACMWAGRDQFPDDRIDDGAWGSRARTRSPGSRAPVDSLTHWLLTGLPLTSKSEPSKSCLWYLRYRSYKPGTITTRGRPMRDILKRGIVGTHAFRYTASTKAQAARGRAEIGPTPTIGSSRVVAISMADESSWGCRLQRKNETDIVYFISCHAYIFVINHYYY